jgi:hypothetical protein
MPSISHTQIYNLLTQFEETKIALLLVIECLEKQQEIIQTIATDGLVTLERPTETTSYNYNYRPHSNTKHSLIIETVVDILSKQNSLSARQLLEKIDSDYPRTSAAIINYDRVVGLSSNISRELKMPKPKIKRNYAMRTVELT